MPKRYVPNDAWSKKAAAEGYRARSVYKLMELDERFKLIKKGMTVLDLGAAPGSWMQYTAEKIGPNGKVIGMDMQEIEPIAENAHTYVQDITDIPAVESILKKEGAEEADLVLSDLAPSTSGVKDVDQWQSVLLSEAVALTASQVLKPGGICVIKIFQGADFDAFFKKMQKSWKSVRAAHVQASRDRSKEVYVLMQR